MHIVMHGDALRYMVMRVALHADALQIMQRMVSSLQMLLLRSRRPRRPLLNESSAVDHRS